MVNFVGLNPFAESFSFDLLSNGSGSGSSSSTPSKPAPDFSSLNGVTAFLGSHGVKRQSSLARQEMIDGFMDSDMETDDDDTEFHLDIEALLAAQEPISKKDEEGEKKEGAEKSIFDDYRFYLILPELMSTFAMPGMRNLNPDLLTIIREFMVSVPPTPSPFDMLPAPAPLTATALSLDIGISFVQNKERLKRIAIVFQAQISQKSELPIPKLRLIILVIDRSLSMNKDSVTLKKRRMAYVREQLAQLIPLLSENDLLSFVTYNTKAEIALMPTRMTEDGKKKAIEMVQDTKPTSKLKPDGDTEITGAMGLAHKMAIYINRLHLERSGIPIQASIVPITDAINTTVLSDLVASNFHEMAAAKDPVTSAITRVVPVGVGVEKEENRDAESELKALGFAFGSEPLSAVENILQALDTPLKRPLISKGNLLMDSVACRLSRAWASSYKPDLRNIGIPLPLIFSGKQVVILLEAEGDRIPMNLNFFDLTCFNNAQILNCKPKEFPADPVLLRDPWEYRCALECVEKFGYDQRIPQTIAKIIQTFSPENLPLASALMQIASVAEEINFKYAVKAVKDEEILSKNAKLVAELAELESKLAAAKKDAEKQPKHMPRVRINRSGIMPPSFSLKKPVEEIQAQIEKVKASQEKLIQAQIKLTKKIEGMKTNLVAMARNRLDELDDLSRTPVGTANKNDASLATIEIVKKLISKKLFHMVMQDELQKILRSSPVGSFFFRPEKHSPYHLVLWWKDKDSNSWGLQFKVEPDGRLILDTPDTKFGKSTFANIDEVIATAPDIMKYHVRQGPTVKKSSGKKQKTQKT